MPAGGRALSRWENEGGANAQTPDRVARPRVIAAPAEIVTRSGFRFHVRPVRPADAVAMAKLMATVSDDDIRFRFPTNGDRTLERMSRIDREPREHFVAVDRSEAMVAIAMLAAVVSGMEAEVAIAVRADYRREGIGWMLLDYVVRYAARHVRTRLDSTQSGDDHIVIELEREMGFIASPCSGEPTRTLMTKNFSAAGASPGMRR